MKKYFVNINSYHAAFFILSILLNIILTVIIFSRLDENQILIYFNSDTLYLPSIYKDIFIDGGGFRGWHLNPAPNFLPDMLMFFIIRSFFNNFIPACFTYSFLQFLILLILLSLLYRSILKSINYLYLSFAALLITLFLLVTLINNDFQYTFYLFSISFHIGAFLMSIASFLFLFNYMKKKKICDLMILLFLGIISILCDLSYLIMFSFPVYALFFLYFTNSANKVKIRNILTINTFSIVVGLLLYRLLKSSGYIHIMGLKWVLFEFKNIIASFKFMIGQHLYYIKEMDFRGLIDILFLLSFIFHAILLGKNLINTRNKNNKLKVNEIEISYLLIFLTFSLFVIFAPIINGRYLALAKLRYNISALYLGIFSYAYLICKLFNSLKFPIKYLRLLIILILTAELMLVIIKYEKGTVLTGLTNFMNYYPEEVKCVDQLSRDENIKYGIAGYWQAKYITMFSKEDVRVYTVFFNLTPWYHAMNENWYYPSPRGKFNNPKFNFVILKWINKKKLIKIFNEPLDTFSCPNGIEIYKYPEIEFDRKTGKPKSITKIKFR